MRSPARLSAKSALALVGELMPGGEVPVPVSAREGVPARIRSFGVLWKSECAWVSPHESECPCLCVPTQKLLPAQ